MTEMLLHTNVILATIALALGYGLGGLRAGALVCVGLGMLWLVGQWRGWGWASAVGLISLTGAAVVGLWQHLESGWMLLGTVAALSAWDLEHFSRRVKAAGQNDTQELERGHFHRLLIVNGLGLLLGVIALKVRIQSGLGAILALALLAVLGLSQLVGFLGRESD